MVNARIALKALPFLIQCFIDTLDKAIHLYKQECSDDPPNTLSTNTSTEVHLIHFFQCCIFKA